MKARIPVAEKFLSSNERRELRREIDRYIDEAYKEREDKVSEDITRRILKVTIAALYESFGFGRERALKVIKAINETLDRAKEDEVFWEHIDQIVIDHFGMEVDRDYTEHGRPAD